MTLRGLRICAHRHTARTRAHLPACFAACTHAPTCITGYRNIYWIRSTTQNPRRSEVAVCRQSPGGDQRFVLSCLGDDPPTRKRRRDRRQGGRTRIKPADDRPPSRGCRRQYSQLGRGGKLGVCRSCPTGRCSIPSLGPWGPMRPGPGAGPGPEAWSMHPGPGAGPGPFTPWLALLEVHVFVCKTPTCTITNTMRF